MYETLEFTFRNGNRVEYKNGEWDDYSYDGKFFSVKKKGANVAMYNAGSVFSVRIF